MISSKSGFFGACGGTVTIKRVAAAEAIRQLTAEVWQVLHG